MGKQPKPTEIEVIVGTILEDHWDRILLIRQRKWDNLYSCFIGGHVEFGEEHLQALRREVREEVGLEIINPRLLDVGESIKSAHYERSAHLIFLNYISLVDENRVYLQPNGEIQEAIWVPPEDALDIVMETNRTTLIRLLTNGTLNGPTEKLHKV